MTSATATKIETMLERSRLAMTAARKTGQPLPAGFVDKIVEVCAQSARNTIVSGNMAAAERLLAKALDFAPDHPDLLIEQAALLLKTNKPKEALPHLRKAIAARPGDPRAHNLAGHALQTLWRLPEAIERFKTASDLRPDDEGFRSAHAHALATAGRMREAADIRRELVARDPDNPEHLRNLAVLLNDSGEIEQARALYQRIITLKPYSGADHRMLSLTGHYAPDDPHIAAMETALAGAADDKTNQCELHFALYGAYDKLGDHDRAFSHLARANRLLGETKGFSDGSEFALMDLIRAFFTEDFTRRMPQSNATHAPIFIVGMPRSGSTLVEQILASHPDVAAAGEVPILQTLVEHELFDHQAGKLKAGLASASPAQLTALAEDYIEALKGVSPPAARLTDKYLSNFLWIGVIRMLLPQARIIHCRRDPLANGFSIFSNYFLTSGLKYKARLEDIGRYQHAYNGLMRHWHACFPGAIHDLSYEALTLDQEGETRRLLDYCGLDWNPACLAFHETRRPVKTASFNQVRKAMYSGVDRKTANYLHHLGPLLRFLDTPGQQGQAPLGDASGDNEGPTR